MTILDRWSEEAREAAKAMRHWQAKHDPVLSHMGHKERKRWLKSVARTWSKHNRGDAFPRSVSVGFDPMGRQLVTYVTQPDGTVVAYDEFGREIMIFEEEDSMRPLFSMGDAGGAFAIIGDAKPSATAVRLYDNIEIDDAAKVSYTADGFMKAMPRIARTGIQIYGGDECGVADMKTVRVYRPPSAVFDAKALHSLTHLPTTLEHPPTAVTPSNWKDHATGETGDEILRDGGTIRVPLMLRDAAAIKAFKDGSKRQLSVGYVCDLIWQDGVVPAGELHAGEAYDAIQQNIHANHLAQCSAARGGPILTIGDGNKENAMTLKTVVVDGVSCEMTDVAAQLVQKTIGKLQADADEFKKKDKDKSKECDDAVKKIADLSAIVATKDAEIATLKKAVTDAALTPAQIDALVTSRQTAIDKAKVILGDSTKFDGKTIEDVRRMVVDKHLGEVAKGWSDAQCAVSFDTIAASIKVGDGPRQGSLDHAVRIFAGRPGEGYRDRATDPQQIRDAAYSESVFELENAWRPKDAQDAARAARKAAGY